ncbi:MAG TPA: tetratricopeptide repeat protein [Clostridia bacterium]|nr:tetratricopeptide repeat protein [Clostridia bacterium]
MAFQSFRADIGEFNLNLHETEIAEAKLVVRRRILECFRFGVSVLKIVYGTPDDFEHSIAKAVHRIVRDHELVVREMLPSYVFSDVEPRKLDPALRVYLRPNPSPDPITSDTLFSPFNPRHERDIAKKLRCKTPYMPLRTSFAPAWAAKAIGHGCTAEMVAAILQQQRRSDVLNAAGEVTWDGVVLAASLHAENRKAKKGRVSVSAPPITESVRQPESLPLKASTGPSELLSQAKCVASESDYEAAETLLLRTINHEESEGAIREEAYLELGKVYLAQDKPEAEGKFKIALQLATERLGKGAHLRPVLELLSQYYLKTSDYDTLFRLAEQNAKAVEELEQPESLDRLFLHALVQFSAGRYSDSLTTLKVFSYRAGNSQIDPSLDARRFDLLGMNYSSLYQLSLAELAFKCALDCCARARTDCEEILPRIFMHQGVLYRRIGRYWDALDSYRESIALLKRAHVTESIFYGDLQSSMGVAYRAVGKLEDAAKCFEVAVELYKRLHQESTPEFASILNNYGVLEMQQAHHEKAESLFDAAKEILELKSSSNCDALVTLQMHRATLYHMKGEFDLAQIAFEEAIEKAIKGLGPNSVRVATAKCGLADQHFNRGNGELAVTLYKEALNVFESSEGTDSTHFKETSAKMQCCVGALRPALQDCESASHDAVERDTSADRTVQNIAERALANSFGGRNRKSLDVFAALRSRQVAKAFKLAEEGNLEDSVDEFEDAELDQVISAYDYRDYAILMFEKEYYSRAYFYFREALSRDSTITLHLEIATFMKEFLENAIDRSGRPRPDGFRRFSELRERYLHSRDI